MRGHLLQGLGERLESESRSRCCSLDSPPRLRLGTAIVGSTANGQGVAGAVARSQEVACDKNDIELSSYV